MFPKFSLLVHEQLTHVLRKQRIQKLYRVENPIRSNDRWKSKFHLRHFYENFPTWKHEILGKRVTEAEKKDNFLPYPKLI